MAIDLEGQYAKERRLEERIAVLEGELRDYERSMEVANRENREKCSELAEKAFEIRELRGVVDAAEAFVEAFRTYPHQWGDALEELRKRLAALGGDEPSLRDSLPAVREMEAETARERERFAEVFGADLGSGCRPILAGLAPTLPREIVDLMAALKASLEVFDPHGLAQEFSAPGGFTPENFGVRTEGHVVEVPAGTLVKGPQDLCEALYGPGGPVDLPPAAAEGAASVNSSPGAAHAAAWSIPLASARLLALLDSEEPPDGLYKALANQGHIGPVTAAWRWLREQLHTGAPGNSLDSREARDPEP